MKCEVIRSSELRDNFVRNRTKLGDVMAFKCLRGSNPSFLAIYAGHVPVVYGAVVLHVDVGNGFSLTEYRVLKTKPRVLRRKGWICVFCLFGRLRARGYF